MKSMLFALLRLFPAAFREHFGDEMRDQISREYDEARARGIVPLASTAVGMALDLLRAALAERWSPVPLPDLQPSTVNLQPHDMSWHLNEWSRDIKHAARSLRRTPGFTAVAIGTLGLAIGANAGMFSVVNEVVLHPFSFPGSDRLVYISGMAPTAPNVRGEFGIADEFQIEFMKQSKHLEKVAIFNSFTGTIRAGERVERPRISWPSHGFFETLGARAALGRLVLPTDDDRTVVISDAMWRNWFGADSTVIGRTIQVIEQSREIVGVMPPDFEFPSAQVHVWLSATDRTQGLVPGRFSGGGIGRIKSGVSDSALAVELTSIARRLPEIYGGSGNYRTLMTTQWQAVVRPLAEQVIGPAASTIWVLFASVGVVLLIACANVANLFMVRSEGRHREMALRQAIGAGRGQLVRLQLAESLVVAGAAAVLAVVIAWVTLPLVIAAAPEGVPRLQHAGISLATLGFTALAAIASALACGIIPALRASSPDIARLRESGRGSTRRYHWGRNGLVAGQTALALVLLIASGLLLRSHKKLANVNPGYLTANVYTFQFAPERPSLRGGPAWAAFHIDFMDRLRALPGVESVGIVENVPLDEGTPSVRFRTEEMGTNPDLGTRMFLTYSGGDYFKAMGIRVIEGRPFTVEDARSTLGNVVVSKSAAKLLWPDRNPIGQRVQRDGLQTWETVVGVVDDVLQNTWREPGQAIVYFPLQGQQPTQWSLSSPAYVVKTQTPARAEVIAPEIRAVVKEVAPEAPMYRAFTMDFLAKRARLQLSFTMLTLGIVSTLALILGAVGLYGVLSYVVAERTREIGVRMALGAEAGQVRRMVVLQGAQVVAVGVAIGLAGAYWTTRYLASLLFGTEAVDPATFAGMSAAMIGIGLLASYMPARRASNVDPIESLRGD